MIDNVEKVIREYLPEVVHMSLATSKDNKPWVCEVHYAYDNDLNLYFISRPSRRHSIEIAQNPNVAGNIVKQHAVGEKPRGVYFEGKAEMLADVDENHIAYKLYTERFGDNTILKEASDENGHRVYKIKVSKFYLFDSQKYELNWRNPL